MRLTLGEFGGVCVSFCLSHILLDGGELDSVGVTALTSSKSTEIKIIAFYR